MLVNARKIMLMIWFICAAGITKISGHVSSSEVSDDMERELINRRHLDGKAKEWHYEGIPIEFPYRRFADNEIKEITTTTTTTTTTTQASPPLDRRYRRIYNPDEMSSIEEHPFMAALLVNKELWCGAVVVARDKVLTAAHCLQLQYNNRFYREYVKMLTVRVGSSNATSGGDVLRVTEIFFHPNYKPQTLEFNFAILRLHKNMTFGNEQLKVEAIEFSRDKVVPVDNRIIFLGWGSVLGPGGIGGKVLLQKVELPIYDLADCQEVYGRDLVTRNNFCAGFITIPKNVCNHDAGGPAVMDGILIGILSFSSKRCDQADQPAVFSTVGAISTWLEGLGERSQKVQLRFTCTQLPGGLHGMQPVPGRRKFKLFTRTPSCQSVPAWRAARISVLLLPYPLA